MAEHVFVCMYLENELHNLCVNKAMDRFSINVCDEVSLS